MAVDLSKQKIDMELEMLDNIKKKKSDIKDKISIEMMALNKQFEKSLKE